MSELDPLNDEPCTCGTPITCLAYSHVMGTKQAANYLGMTPRGIRFAVGRSKNLNPVEVRGERVKIDGEWLFDRDDLDAYNETHRKHPVAKADQ